MLHCRNLNRQIFQYRQICNLPEYCQTAGLQIRQNVAAERYKRKVAAEQHKNEKCLIFPETYSSWELSC